MDDLRPLHRAAIETATTWVRRVAPDDLGRSTPCGPWTLADLLAHMVGQHEGFAAAVRDGDAASSAYAPVPFTIERWDTSVATMLAAFDTANLDSTVIEIELAPTPLRVGRLVAAQFLDTVVHTWDVAQSFGEWYEPPGNVADMIARIAAGIPDDDRRDRPGAAFGHAVATSGSTWQGALALLGRDPRLPTLPLTPDELLTTTRTVRKRLDLSRPVPMALVRECLEIALQAPSGSNRQGWQWIVVVDPDKRRRIGDIYREETEKYLESGSSAAALFADDPERAAVQRRIGTSVAWLAEHMGDVPVLVIPCLRAGRTLPAGNQAGLWGSVLPAVWNYMLAARARGLGTAWTTLHLGREAEVARVLEIPEKVHQAALVPTAFYTGETFRPAPRLPLDDVLHIDRW